MFADPFYGGPVDTHCPMRYSEHVRQQTVLRLFQPWRTSGACRKVGSRKFNIPPRHVLHRFDRRFAVVGKWSAVDASRRFFARLARAGRRESPDRPGAPRGESELPAGDAASIAFSAARRVSARVDNRRQGVRRGAAASRPRWRHGDTGGGDGCRLPAATPTHRDDAAQPSGFLIRAALKPGVDSFDAENETGCRFPSSRERITP